LELLSDTFDAEKEDEGEEEGGTGVHHNSLARISIDNFSVKGDVTVSNAIKVKAGLENVVLEDTRFAAHGDQRQRRIVRLLEAKTGSSGNSSSAQKGEEADTSPTSSAMIALKYERDVSTAEIVEIDVNSFVVVASVAYLLAISDFFVPKEVVDYENIISGIGGGGETDEKDAVVTISRPSTPTQQPPVRKILFRMAESDIILVNDIDDLNTDAIVLNAELALNLFQKPEKLSMQLILDNLRGHTCKFDPAVRDSTLAQILRPTNMAMHFNQANVSDPE
jgi:vacuolar protein sorting-associated protein 13A/C